MEKSLNKSKIWDFIKKYKIYFSILLITFIVKEFFPFSFYPMYNQFPNYAYIFYITDEHQQVRNDLMRINAGELSHLYFTECENQQIEYGNGVETKEQLNIIGLNITQQAIDLTAAKEVEVKDLQLYRIYSHFENNQMVLDTLLLSNLKVE